ncbi:MULTISPECIES: hypothetical protein [Rhodococcus]|nr:MULTISPECIES: hypothetical protein [Rhodococcus]WAM14919.1 hypothetical protein OYT95_37080 [Rhodococcus sp. JS3073]
MGLSRLVLDLPRSWPNRDALEAAAVELRERGIGDWSALTV